MKGPNLALSQAVPISVSNGDLKKISFKIAQFIEEVVDIVKESDAEKIAGLSLDFLKVNFSGKQFFFQLSVAIESKDTALSIEIGFLT